MREDKNQDAEKEEEKNIWWGDDLLFPRGLFKVNGVWRDRHSTLDYLDSKSDLLKLEELIFIPVPVTEPPPLPLKSSVMLKLINYRQKHPSLKEYKVVEAARYVWPEVSNHNCTLYTRMYNLFKRYPSVFSRPKLGYFSFTVSDKEILTMIAQQKRERMIKFRKPSKWRLNHQLKREVSVETIRRYARTPEITAKELSKKCDISIPTAAAYIAHANRVKNKKNLSRFGTSYRK